MSTSLSTSVYLLPVTGRRNGAYKQLVGHVRVQDDEFTKTVLVKKSWHLAGGGYVATDVRDSNGRLRPMYLHQIVYDHYHGKLAAGLVIDHIDRDKLNNQPKNLRAATYTMNAMNRSISRRNRSGYLGVSWDRKRCVWVAWATSEGKNRYLGASDDPTEAARRVNDVFKRYHPELPIPNPTAELVMAG